MKVLWQRRSASHKGKPPKTFYHAFEVIGAKSICGIAKYQAGDGEAPIVNPPWDMRCNQCQRELKRRAT